MKRRKYCYILFLLILLIFLPIKNQKTYLKDIKWLEGNQLENIIPWYAVDEHNIYLDKKIKIGIIDGPVSTTHDQTKNLEINTLKLTSGVATEDIEHGTSVLGVITSNDKKGPFKSMLSIDNVEIYNAVVLDNGYASQSDILEAFVWLKKQDIDIINISIDIKEYTSELKDEIKEITNSQIPILFSNGNGNYSTAESSKIIYDYVWYIGMQTVDGKYKNEITDPKKRVFYLPGEYILSLSHKKKYSIYNGASYSTAIATSIIGDKMLSLERKLSKEEINHLLSKYNLEE